jgi:hypothetical protein
MAARRMNGVVRPQQAPTMRKPSIHRKTEGWGAGVVGVSGSIALVYRILG